MNLPEDLAHLIQPDCPLAERNTLGLGGPAQYFAEPVSVDDVQKLVAWANENSLAVRILGGGSNLLIRESGVEGLVLSLQSAATSGFEVDGGDLTVGAGARLSQAVVKAVGEGLGGLEHLIGIPGTVGGAVIGNASAGGRDISAVLLLGDQLLFFVIPNPCSAAVIVVSAAVTLRLVLSRSRISRM